LTPVMMSRPPLPTYPTFAPPEHPEQLVMTAPPVSVVVDASA
jgi:hypothetical protein